MRIENKNIKVSSVLFSKSMGIIYLIVFCLFVYKSLMLLPIWLSTKDKGEEARLDYERKLQAVEDKKQLEENKETDLGKERYQKEFFNKLDDGENMIVLYGDEQKKEDDEQMRKMFWWQEQKQNFLVWWRNLHILKY